MGRGVGIALGWGRGRGGGRLGCGGSGAVVFSFTGGFYLRFRDWGREWYAYVPDEWEGFDVCGEEEEEEGCCPGTGEDRGGFEIAQQGAEGCCRGHLLLAAKGDVRSRGFPLKSRGGSRMRHCDCILENLLNANWSSRE